MPVSRMFTRPNSTFPASSASSASICGIISMHDSQVVPQKSTRYTPLWASTV